jgi:hypothetical protein
MFNFDARRVGPIDLNLRLCGVRNRIQQIGRSKAALEHISGWIT